MMKPETSKNNESQHAMMNKMDVLIGYVLLAGVVASVALLIAGLGWHWLRSGQLTVDYTLPQSNLFEFVATEMRDIAAGQFRPRLLISLGIVALLLTPYLRVLASLLFFAFVSHNWKYSAFTGFVLVVLTYSLFLR